MGGKDWKVDDKRLRKIADEALDTNKIVFDRLAEI